MYYSCDFNIAPVIDDRPLAWSVGRYRGGHRVVVAWFQYQSDAFDYLYKCQAGDPYFKFDVAHSLF